MKNFFKKNQIIVFVIGLMLITAGYLNFSNNENSNSLEAGKILDSEQMAGIGDAKLVSANVAEINSIENNAINNEGNDNTAENVNEVESSSVVDDDVSDGIEENNETNTNNGADDKNNNEKDIQTNSNANSNEYFASSKLDRNTMYSQRIENYQDILNNTNVSEAQKKIAQEEISKIGEEQNAIMIAENLIKTKGIGDLVILVNGESINVIVKGEELEKDEIAQIQNIVTRELKADIENIHIMNKN